MSRVFVGPVSADPGGSECDVGRWGGGVIAMKAVEVCTGQGYLAPSTVLLTPGNRALSVRKVATWATKRSAPRVLHPRIRLRAFGMSVTAVGPPVPPALGVGVL